MSPGTDGTYRIANLATHTHVDEASSPADIHQNHRHPSPSFSSSKIRIEHFGVFTRDYLANGKR